MTFVSYAQNYEDVVLFRALAGVEHGVYVDVGAQDPINDSVTKAFYERGWRGVNIEPVDEWFVRIEADRPEDTNLRVAISGAQRQMLLHRVAGTGMSTASDEFAQRHRDAGLEVTDNEVRARTLDSVFGEFALSTVHFLKIDVEGLEGDVLRSIDLTRHRPWIVLLESTEPNSTVSTHRAWEELLTGRGYRFALFDGLNRFYVADEQAALMPALAVPPNYFDNFIRYPDLVVHRRCGELEEDLRLKEAAIEHLRHEAMVEVEVRHAEHNALEQRLDAIRAQALALDEQRFAIQAQHDSLRAERDALAAERLALEGQLRAAGTENSSLRLQTEALEEQRIALEWQRDALGAQRQALEGERVALEAGLRAATEESGTLRSQLAESNERLAARGDRLHSHQEQTEHAQAELARVQAEASRLVAQLEVANDAVESARSQLASSNVDLDRSRAEQAATANRLRVNERELAAVYASRSWRITAPLRELNLRVRQAGRTLIGPEGPLRAPVRIALEAGLGIVRRTPLIRPALVGAIGLVPPLDRRLRRFAQLRPDRTRLARPRAVAVATPATDAADAPRRLYREAAGDIVYYYVDHTVTCPVNTGMQRVVRCLARDLIMRGVRVVFVKLDVRCRSLVLVNRAELDHLASWQGPVVTAAERMTYPEPGSDGSSVEVPSGIGGWLVVPEVPYINYHGTPLTSEVIIAARRCALKTAFVFYDAVPLRRPEFADVSGTHASYMEQLLLADVVMPISAWSEADLLRLFASIGTPRAQMPIVRTIALAGDVDSCRRPAASLCAESRRILSVGTLERRKNQLTLVAAFEKFVRMPEGADWELVFVGNVHGDVAVELAAAMARTSRIRSFVNITDEALNELYVSASFTVFPSIEEGFGLPITESVWHGRACICANFGAMAEVAVGGGCLTVDVRNTDVLLSAIRSLATDADRLAELTQQAVARKLRSWSDYAADVSALLSEASNPVSRLGTVYYCVEHTCEFPHNTGIQRVVRGLAGALIEAGVRLVPVRWDAARNRIYRASPEALSHLSRWNGPPPEGWSSGDVPEAFSMADWLLMPELTVYPGGPNLDAVRAFCHLADLRCAWIFYDAIPWKLRQFYPPHWRTVHGDYMRALNRFELVLAISCHSRDDLRDFLRSIADRTPDLERRIVACPLPGEFREAGRVTAIKTAGPSIRILAVGSVEPRKNHATLLDAFERARASMSRPTELVIAGGCHLPEADALAFRQRVRVAHISWIEHPDDTTLRALYESADFTVYPSVEEGFGLPILESLWNGRPCICRNAGAMAEVAEGGGCLTVDTTDVAALSSAILSMSDDDGLRERLAREATTRAFKTWLDYGRDVARLLADERYVPAGLPPNTAVSGASEQETGFVNSTPRPLLSICISTYNRAGWLDIALANLQRIWPITTHEVEILVCDNASNDTTESVAAKYRHRSDLRYVRNQVNVGMLGNLRVTAQQSRGRFVWILGDDDLLVDGAVETVLSVLRKDPARALVYLNYAYTREADPTSVSDIGRFLAGSIPIVEPGPDAEGLVREVVAKSENFFTAIYCLVFRRDHALRAYSQNTEGRPFSTMLTAIPTTYYVLHQMMRERAYWIGRPLVVVNMNVSWMKYAPLWILERLPEVFDRAETLGGDPASIDRWRLHNLPGVVHFFKSIFEDDSAGNRPFFSAARLVTRFKHLPEFGREADTLRSIYEAARARGAEATELSSDQLFAPFRAQ
jgi:FkbM family methyltransferase